MAAGIVAGGVVLLLTVTYVDDKLRARDEARKQDVLLPMVGLLVQDAEEATKRFYLDVVDVPYYNGNPVGTGEFGDTQRQLRHLLVALAPLLADREDGRDILTTVEPFARALDGHAEDRDAQYQIVRERLLALQTAAGALTGSATATDFSYEEHSQYDDDDAGDDTSNDDGSRTYPMRLAPRRSNR